MFGTSAVVIAAPPGSPFYTTRMALETAFLPTQVDDRLASHQQHIEERLAEAQAAAARGDLVALEAALAAYRSEVDAAVADIGDNADRLAKLEGALAKHTAVLHALAARLPAQAAIEHAIEASQKATKKLKDRAATPAGGKPSQPPGGGQSR
jgi:chromosome segregation ATPase